MRKGFTLIELLVVLGILGVLVVVALIALNPAEGQKKARDTQRMKDMATLEAIMQQYIAGGGAPFCTGAGGCNSTGAGTNVSKQSCSSNWLGVNVCSYANTVPADPNNNTTRTVITGGTVTAPTFGTATMQYRLMMSGSDYEVNVMQESGANANNVLSDGGNSTQWVESGSDPGLDLLGN